MSLAQQASQSLVLRGNGLSNDVDAPISALQLATDSQDLALQQSLSVTQGNLWPDNHIDQACFVF